jgi:carbamoyl-phosphate synthase large subunit
MSTSDRRAVTVLVSSAGRRGALVKALRHGASMAQLDIKVVATDRSSLSAAGHLADAFHLVPSLDAPDFIDVLCRVVARESVDVIVPTIDTELALLAANRQRLAAAGAVVLVSDPACIEICSDKARSSRWLSDHGYPVPRQYELAAAAELEPGRWPLFFKPRQGSSSIGAQPVPSMDELLLAISRHGDGVIEELVAGDEYTMDCWVDPDGVCLGVVPRLRLAVRAGEIAKGVTVAHPELDALTRSVVETMSGLRGPVTVQAIVGPDGPRFIEINARFGGGYPLSHEAGAWYTAVLLAEVLGRQPDPAWLTWQDDLVMLRYDEAVFVPRSRLGGS